MTTFSRDTLSRMTFLSAAHFLAAGLGFIVVTLIARHHGAAALGQISLALSVMMQATVVTKFGTDQYGVRQVASKNESAASVAGSVIVLRVVTACVAFGAVLALPFVSPQFEEIQILLAILGLCVFPTILRLEWICQAFHRTNVYGLQAFSIQALYASLVVTAVIFSMDLWAVAAARLVAEVVVVVILFVWVSRNLTPVRFDHRIQHVGSVARASAPIAGTQLLRGLCFASDVIILGLLVSASDLGHYVSGFQIFMFAVALNSAYSVILFPRIAAHANSLSDAMAKEVRRSLRLTIPVALVAASLLAALASQILALFFGPEYTHGSVSLQLLCVALVINLLNRHYRQVLIARGRQRTDLRLTAVGTFVHIASKFAFIPFLGIAGAALGTVVGEIFLLAALRHAALPVLRSQE